MSQSSEPKLLRRLYFFFFFDSLLHPALSAFQNHFAMVPQFHLEVLVPLYACTGLHLVKCSNFTVQNSLVFFFGSWDIRPAFIRNFIGCVEAFGALRIIQTFQPRQLLMLIESLKGTFWPCRSIVFASIQVYIFCWIPFRLLKCTHHFL